MSYKRSRATFEADNNKNNSHAPYALFGTPLPDEGERDDGSYLPLWKQDVRDEKGRRRLHGAFTGGWSAGYFNTVGSKEGWTPSTFVSSRSDRRKDEPGRKLQRAEDFMDEEDLADATEAQAIKTSQAFSGLGFSTSEEMRAGGLMGLLRAKGDTMGLRLLRRMGWKEGQGIGPKVRRAARLELGSANASAGGVAETYLFAPENTEMIQFVRKTDRRGLGGLGGRDESRPSSLRRGGMGKNDNDDDNDDDDDEQDDDGMQRDHNHSARTSLLGRERPKSKAQKGGFGVGVLNDTGSDEEDPYEMGPKIKYNRVMGGDKKKKATTMTKKGSAAANPSLKTAPVFTLKKMTGPSGNSLRRCHDGRLPLDGFVLARTSSDPLVPLTRYAPPPVPPGWKSSKSLDGQGAKAEFVSTADAARTSTHDHRSRAAVLGEKALPGKSVFDYISAVGRDKIAAASGKKDLPPARGEVPEELRLSEEERLKSLWDQVPRLDRDTALAALARSSRGPYADDEAKRSRYRQFLESHTGSGQPPPAKRNGASDDDFLREMNEFYNCARIFKPMTGFMASRFTTAKAAAGGPGGTPKGQGDADGCAGGPEPQLQSEPEPTDPAEEAAKMGMFGTMTRSVQDFYPTRLLCKRFNVKAPAHASRANGEPGPEPPVSTEASALYSYARTPTVTGPAVGAAGAADIAQDAGGAVLLTPKGETSEGPSNDEVRPDENKAVDAAAANADLLRAVFGDSDDDD
ncbi:G patch domain-containing protein 1 [Escovopsis weberi]|uniref:G patch domain-containing protein 1 n=1 Tax=Escovopsis weberi TaxID=150374 RepID=A0A0M8N0Q6_ESCWE|nr:G patch domain-containing protein 1 [Escovopsis weberi]